MVQTNVNSPADAGGEPLVSQGPEAEATDKAIMSPLSIKGERILRAPTIPSPPLDDASRTAARHNFVEAMKTKGVVVEPGGMVLTWVQLSLLHLCCFLASLQPFAVLISVLQSLNLCSSHVIKCRSIHVAVIKCRSIHVAD
jgi:hypothetical protein